MSRDVPERLRNNVALQEEYGASPRRIRNYTGGDLIIRAYPSEHPRLRWTVSGNAVWVDVKTPNGWKSSIRRSVAASIGIIASDAEPGTEPTGDTSSADPNVDADFDWPERPDQPAESEVDPSNYAGIVNADNDEGVALAPTLRREGASLGPDGATVTLPDGETVDVGAISDSDEVARYLEGDDAGGVVDADQPAVDSDSSSGGSGGMIGGAVAVVLALLVGAAALLGGGD